MTRDELMEESGSVLEVSWESVEFLFRPNNMFELLLRFSDLEGMRKKVGEWHCDNSPSAMPHRFRLPYLAQMNRAIDVEEFYRKIKLEAGE